MLPMQCPKCSGTDLRTPITNSRLPDQTMRKKRCQSCGHEWFTVELAVPNYAVGWAVEHQRKPVLRVPVELTTTYALSRGSHLEAKDQIELLRQSNRRRSEEATMRYRRMKECD